MVPKLEKSAKVLGLVFCQIQWILTEKYSQLFTSSLESFTVNLSNLIFEL